MIDIFEWNKMVPLHNQVPPKYAGLSNKTNIGIAELCVRVPYVCLMFGLPYVVKYVSLMSLGSFIWVVRNVAIQLV